MNRFFWLSFFIAFFVYLLSHITAHSKTEIITPQPDKTLEQNLQQIVSQHTSNRQALQPIIVIHEKFCATCEIASIKSVMNSISKAFQPPLIIINDSPIDYRETARKFFGNYTLLFDTSQYFKGEISQNYGHRTKFLQSSLLLVDSTGVVVKTVNDALTQWFLDSKKLIHELRRGKLTIRRSHAVNEDSVGFGTIISINEQEDTIYFLNYTSQIVSYSVKDTSSHRLLQPFEHFTAKVENNELKTVDTTTDRWHQLRELGLTSSYPIALFSKNGKMYAFINAIYDEVPVNKDPNAKMFRYKPCVMLVDKSKTTILKDYPPPLFFSKILATSTGYEVLKFFLFKENTDTLKENTDTTETTTYGILCLDSNFNIISTYPICYRNQKNEVVNYSKDTIGMQNTFFYVGSSKESYFYQPDVNMFLMKGHQDTVFQRVDLPKELRAIGIDVSNKVLTEWIVADVRGMDSSCSVILIPRKKGKNVIIFEFRNGVWTRNMIEVQPEGSEAIEFAHHARVSGKDYIFTKFDKRRWRVSELYEDTR